MAQLEDFTLLRGKFSQTVAERLGGLTGHEPIRGNRWFSPRPVGVEPRFEPLIERIRQLFAGMCTPALLSLVMQNPEQPSPHLRSTLEALDRFADACPADAYAARLNDAGFIDVTVENHDAALLEMIRNIGSRLFAADILRGLQKIDLEGIDLVAANRMTRQALVAVSERRLGYAVMCAAKPERSGGQING